LGFFVHAPRSSRRAIRESGAPKDPSCSRSVPGADAASWQICQKYRVQDAKNALALCSRF
jgi:hypothetical protein